MNTVVYLVYNADDNIVWVGRNLGKTCDMRDLLERESVLKGNDDIGKWTIGRESSAEPR